MRRLTRRDVSTTVKKIISERSHFAPKDLVEQHSLAEDLSLDSLDIIEIQRDIQKGVDPFGPSWNSDDWLPAGEATNLTVGQVVDRVCAQLQIE